MRRLLLLIALALVLLVAASVAALEALTQALGPVRGPVVFGVAFVSLSSLAFAAASEWSLRKWRREVAPGAERRDG